MNVVSRKLLIVEDHQETRRALTVLAEMLGYTVDEAATVAEALAKLSEQHKVILDLRLPDGTGVDVLRKIRSLGMQTKVAIMSAWAQCSVQTEALQLQPDSYMVKLAEYDAFVAWLAEEKQ